MRAGRLNPSSGAIGPARKPLLVPFDRVDPLRVLGAVDLVQVLTQGRLQVGCLETQPTDLAALAGPETLVPELLDRRGVDEVNDSGRVRSGLVRY